MPRKSKVETQFADTQAAENLVKGILAFIGEDPNREGLKETPARVIRSYKELFAGYSQDPKKILRKSFQVGKYDQMVWLGDIEFFSTCEHHMLPFHGKAHVAYIPKDHVVGISKLARLVDVFAKRLQIQERMTQQIAETLDAVTSPLGVGVVIQAKHFCMCARGVNKQNSIMTTSALTGQFLEPAVKAEFLNLINRR